MVSCREEGGISWFFPSCSRRFAILLQLFCGTQGVSHVASGKLNLHVSCEGPLGILPLQSVQGPRSSSGAEARTSRFLSSADMDLGVPMEFNRGGRPRFVWRHGTLLSARAVKVMSGFLSSSGGESGLLQEDQQGSQASHHVVRGSSVFLLSCCRGIRTSLELSGNSVSFSL